MPRLDALPLCPTNNSQNEALFSDGLMMDNLPLCPALFDDGSMGDNLPLCPTDLSIKDFSLTNAARKTLKVSKAAWALAHPKDALIIRQNFVQTYGKKYEEMIKELLEFENGAGFDESYKEADLCNVNSDKLSVDTLKELKDALRKMADMVGQFNDRNNPV
jgi:hypothetical protein